MEIRFEDIDFGCGTTTPAVSEAELGFDFHDINFEDQMDIFLGNKTFDEVCNIYEYDKGLSLQKTPTEFTHSLSYDEKISNEIEDSLSQHGSESEKTQNSKQTSAHHNFQKHTVTALRSLITFETIQNLCENSSALEATLSLWSSFLNIKGKKIMTKKFLYTLLCAEESQIKSLESYGFEQFVKKFSASEIVEAQKELRLIAYRTFSLSNITLHVKSRSLERKEEFIKYLQEYRENELRTGQVKKRMSKGTSDKPSEL